MFDFTGQLNCGKGLSMILAAIEATTALPNGWDGYDGVAPSAAAVARATAFMRRLPSNLPAPSVEPSGDGELNLVWRGDGYIELGFYGDGSAALLAEIDGKTTLADFSPRTL